MHWVRIACCLLCWLLPWAAGAQADEPPAEVQRSYRELAARAVEEFDAGHFAEARALFLRAHALWPSARTLRTLGMTAFDLRMYPQALRELQAALADQRRPLDTAQRGQVEALIDKARDLVGEVELRLSPADAEVTVDGAAYQPEPGTALALGVGDHELVARAPGFRELHRRLQVDGRRRETLSLVLEREPALSVVGTPQPTAAQPRLELTAPTPRERAPDAFLVARRVALLVGALGLATGVGAGLLALDRKRVVGRECDDAKQCSARGLDAASAGRAYALASDIGSAVALLGFGSFVLLPGGWLNPTGPERALSLWWSGQL